MPAERRILDELWPRLSDLAMLDLGVGGGRTTAEFAPLVGRYVGIDFSPKMIEVCRARYGAIGHASFAVCDVREMSMLDDGAFDFVLFSHNGLDAVGDVDTRANVLAEIRRVCARGGLLAFSAHNLNWVDDELSLAKQIRVRAASRPLPVAAVKGVAHGALWRTMNPSTGGLDEALLVDERHGRKLISHVYIRPSRQVVQLEELGFEDVRVFDVPGEVAPAEALAGVGGHFLHYAAVKR
jgi:SAM-dependent methyltransferase